MKVNLEYGETAVEVDIPDENCCGVLEPNDVGTLKDVSSEVERSLRVPISSEQLAEKLKHTKTVMILTVDATRPSPKLLLQPILRLCRAYDVKATICIALGRHSPMGERAILGHLGQEIAENVEVIQHDPFDEELHVELGVTSRGTPIKVNKAVIRADLNIGVGFIEPSYIMGYSGGGKLIMPGVSHVTSIDSNHFWLTDPQNRIGKLDGNPVYEDATEFVQKVRFDWIICAVLGARDEYVKIISGNPYVVHRQGCQVSDRIYRVKGPKADIVISVTGGFPYDCDLVQGKKGIIPAFEAVNEKGAIIILAECRDGWGAEGTFRDWLKNKSPQQVVEDVKKRHMFSLGAHGAFILARPIVEKQAKVIFVTNETMRRELEATYVTAVTSIAEALAIAQEYIGRKPTYLVVKSSRRLILE